ncbi:hypothetical protein PFISCL1PPCAC_21294, partial [Pristionchus fissidentatus]
LGAATCRFRTVNATDGESEWKGSERPELTQIYPPNESLQIRYSRNCKLCQTLNPQIRSVFSSCGHIVCMPCADQLPLVGTNGKRCPLCRKRGEVVRIFEDLIEDGIGITLMEMLNTLVQDFLKRIKSSEI